MTDSLDRGDYVRVVSLMAPVLPSTLPAALVRFVAGVLLDAEQEVSS
jgi:hypothetical protein